jgi:peptidoglycan/xylan/chitin deacetylase (PgdA/CDA1 family)
MICRSDYQFIPTYYTPACFVLTLDDSIRTDYTEAYRILLEKGVPYGTSFRNTENKWITKEEWREMRANGWDIQCHTHSHPHLPLLTEQEIRGEMETVNAQFEEDGLPYPHHHATPYGESNGFVAGIIGEYRKTMRTDKVGVLEDYDTFDFMKLARVGIDDTYQPTYMATVKSLIDEAAETSKIFIGMGHRIYADRFTVEAFTELVDYALGKGLIFVTMSRLYELLYNYRFRFRKTFSWI